MEFYCKECGGVVSTDNDKAPTGNCPRCGWTAHWRKRKPTKPDPPVNMEDEIKKAKRFLAKRAWKRIVETMPYFPCMSCGLWHPPATLRRYCGIRKQDCDLVENQYGEVVNPEVYRRERDEAKLGEMAVLCPSCFGGVTAGHSVDDFYPERQDPFGWFTWVGERDPRLMDKKNKRKAERQRRRRRLKRWNEEQRKKERECGGSS